MTTAVPAIAFAVLCVLKFTMGASLQHTTLADGVYLAGNFMELGIRSPSSSAGGKFGADSVPPGFYSRQPGLYGMEHNKVFEVASN